MYCVNVIAEIFDFCLQNNINSFCDLVDYSRLHNFKWFKVICDYSDIVCTYFE